MDQTESNFRFLAMTNASFRVGADSVSHEDVLLADWITIHRW